MPAQAFDGSIWVAGGQIAGLVGSTVVFAGISTYLAVRGIERNQALAPPPNIPQGRRKQRLVQQRDRDGREPPQLENIDAERLEDVIVDENADGAAIDEALREVSKKPKK